jgi:DNA-binding response OmpR family regulator
MTRVVVVEDNADLAYGLRNNLEIEGYEVDVAEDGPAGLQAVRGGRPALVILDLMLPGMDGFRVLKTLREEGHSMPVLILTARGEEADKVRGLKMGADDYITKPFGLLELLARIEALLRRGQSGGAFPGGAVRLERFGDVEVEARTRSVFRRGESVDLAPKEFDLLLALLRARGGVVSRLDLMTQVWGYSAAVVSRTVDTHVAELRRKLEDRPSEPRHLLTVRKIGYRLRR